MPIEMVGMEDTFAELGDYELLLKKYGLSAENIVDKVNEIIKKRL